MDSVSIIIRCKDEALAIGKTLEMIAVQEIDLPYEVVVIDSGSTDRTVEIVKSFKTRLFEIPPEAFTFGYALNYGIEKAEGSIIVNLSAHCAPTNVTWLKELLVPIIKSSVQATFGRQVTIKGVNVFEEIALKKHFPEHGEIKGRQPFSNANCAFLKDLWHEQRFDEELSSWEDYLWYFLLKDRYTFQYCPKAAVYHSHPFSVKSIARRAYIDGRAFKLIKKKYNVDFLDGVCPTLKTKGKIFFEDIKNHVRLFQKEGYYKHIALVPIVRFLAYKSYWEGYNSI